ncbi:substrate-binding periplasmic protein [Rhodospirillum sp. A1_3_36]|uniref:substrate-binding periplasmic protein n=1 Tax=Rhodospirillum sp. A1_3_36 TaxID=3391666 RepID=UPI0039A64C8B
MSLGVALVLGMPFGLLAGAGGEGTALAQSTRSDLTQPVTLTTLYWPPFTGQDLPDGGTSTGIVRRSLEIEGLDTAVTFLPWRRAVDMTTMGYVDAVFPVYGARDRNCVLSHPFQASVLGFVERVDAPVSWKTLDDLADRPIGVVKGYINGETFDRAVEKGTLTVESVVTDVMNLRKVEAGRLDLAVIDRDLLTFLLTENPETLDLAGRLQFNARALDVKSLYACFHNSKRGDLLRRAFNEGLAVVMVQAAAAKEKE